MLGKFLNSNFWMNCIKAVIAGTASAVQYGGMLDPFMRRIIDPPLAQVAKILARLGVSANSVTLIGFLFGLSACPVIAFEHYQTGFALFFIGRICDGLDGAVARYRSATDLGGYFDIVADFIVYSGFVLGFALARPENALPAAILLFSFMGTGSTFLTYAIFAAKRGLTTDTRGSKALYYLGGLTEGSETIAIFALFCLLPEKFALTALIFAGLCGLTTITRILTAARTFREKN